MVRASSRAEALREQIQRDAEVPAYVTHAESLQLYKIRAGDCETPEQAGKLRDEIRALGFHDAYVVRVQVVETLPKVAVQPRVEVATPGFRVQLFSSSTERTAQEVQNQARAWLKRDDVVVEFDDPNFKVCVGNFQTREDAEKFLEEVKSVGYETAFIVQANPVQ